MMNSRVIRRTGMIDPHPARALAGLFDLEPDSIGPHLPPMWHWVYLLDAWKKSELGLDGHSLNGMPSPPAGDYSRMFAGGRTTHLRPLEFGVEAEKTSRVVSSTDKQGRSGPLTFVTVRHEYRQAGNTVIVEEQDIVYKPLVRAVPQPEQEAGLSNAAPTVPGQPNPAEMQFKVDNVTLFLFSALTYNAHRIHYDRAYAASEGHRDLVIHGPFQIMLMAETLRARGVSMYGAEFGYRLLAPATGPQALSLGAVPDESHPDPTVQVTDETGVIVARSQLRSADPAHEGNAQWLTKSTTA